MTPPNGHSRCSCEPWTIIKVCWQLEYLYIPLILPLGEEADIIVLSLVRNITEGGGRGGIGFLKVST